MVALLLFGCRRAPAETAAPADATTTATAPAPAKPADAAAPAPAKFARTPGRVAAGTAHSCAVTAAGEVWCWGANDTGQLGDGREVASREPVRVVGLSDVTAVTAGDGHTCALQRTGEVWCWGFEPQSERAWESFTVRRTPVRVTGLPPARAIAAGRRFTCATTDDSVWCMGLSGWTPRTGVFTTPMKIGGVARPDQICGADSFACARTGGEVRCWGPGTDFGWLPGSPQVLPDLAGATAMSCGYGRVCAVGAAGEPRCTRTLEARLPPTRMHLPADQRDRPEGLAPLIDLTLVGLGMCGTSTAGSIACWQDMVWDYAAAEDEPFTVQTAARPTHPRAIAGGSGHACALDQDGRVWCWGANRHGQAGGGASQFATTPERVDGADGLTDLVAGDGYTCGLRDGRAWCWGDLDFQIEVTPTEQGRPVALGPAGGLAELVAGDAGLCWRDRAEVVCHQASPRGGPSRTTRKLAAGTRQLLADGCVLLRDGVVECGQYVLDARSFRDGEKARAPYQPTDIVEIARAGSMLCGRRRGGSVACVKLETTVLRAGAVRLANERPLQDAVELGATDAGLCAVRRGGGVVCWSTDSYFELIARPLPDTGDIAALGGPGCLVRRDGTVACRGINYVGEVGDGTVVRRDTHRAVRGLADVREVVGSSGHTCARLGQGEVWCWGDHLAGPRMAAALSAYRDEPYEIRGLPPM